jgi:putative Ig domain-containing protein
MGTFHETCRSRSESRPQSTSAAVLLFKLSLRRVLWLAMALNLLTNFTLARQQADATQLALDPVTLPNAAPHHEYKYQFKAHGGIPPYKHAISEGALPTGMQLSTDGLLTGSPPAVGQFRFTISVTDTSNPPQKASRSFLLKVLAPMLMQWKRYPQVNGNRIDGSIIVSNSTQDDFDFTFIVLAVADNGRATAIGYQRFPLKNGTESFEIAFGDTLPHGTYEVHVDAVAEVPEKYRIYRSRLQTKERLPIAVGP